jgi:DNA-binding protein YbaB
VVNREPATPETTARLRSTYEQLLGELDRVKRQAGQARADLRKVSGRAESRTGLVTVTVGPRGDLTGLEISPRAYQKLSPSLLAEEILRLVGEATAQATERAGAVMAPLLPPGMSYVELLDGRAEPPLPTSGPAEPEKVFDQWWARLGQQPGPR